ncbi:hypothetical protein BD311DRAFT_778781 [Dichomitus squalens]|uniref:N-acetyltransferase domain-containing protein n=1 Tax=Dichomitus squalens TaxID=114155 RepID=A0A4Q9MLL6_9APHY|nr:hypothetical protein BD311DRAFT_778781 [Dichomitus squalens]
MRSDSLTRYLRAGDFSSAFYDLRDCIAGILRHIEAIRLGRALTVDHGDAVCTFRLPEDKDSKLHLYLMGLLRKIQTKEFTKRQTEVRGAIGTLFRENLGDREAEPIDIVLLGTSPEKQGHGYGKALVKAVTDIGDAKGLAVTVVTTDAYKFYEAVGFKLVAETIVGVDNPSWDGAPIHVRLLLREPHRHGSGEEQIPKAASDESSVITHRTGRTEL